MRDVRLAVRLLIKGRWITIVAAVTLALGIASNAAVFTLVNAVLLRGVPFPDPDTVVALGTRDTRNRNLGVSYHDFLDWQESTRSFSAMSLMGQPPFNVGEEGRAPERYNGAYVSAGTFGLIGAQALIGRGFIPEDDLDGASPVVVLGHGIWQSRYGGDRSILGRTIRVQDLPATVVGVMPPGMQFHPISAATFRAAISLATPQSDPGTTGMPSATAVRLASILSPIIRMCSALGPMNAMLWAARISAKRAFSERKP
jgi:hypothetical protein